MNYILLFCFVLFTFISTSNAQYIKLLGNWKSDHIDTADYNNAYNDVWGFVKDSVEYAAIGSAKGIFIIDVSDPENLKEIDFVPASYVAYNSIHRDIHEHNGYLYIVGDQAGNVDGVYTEATLQIVKLNSLPDSVEVVYDDSELLMRAHNIFIDTATSNLYAASHTDRDWGNKSLVKYSLANPELPEYIGYVGEFGWNAHDMYVKNDTVYFHAGTNGFFIYDWTGNDAEIISQIIAYEDQGYCHSGWLSDNGENYVMIDETHGTRIKMLEFDEDLNPTVIDLFGAHRFDTNTVAHNVLIKGDYAYVSYYFDGFYVFDISDPYNVTEVDRYSTNAAERVNDDFKGAWGIYPHFDSGKILVSDMDNGLFVFSMDADTSSSTISIDELMAKENGVHLFPNPSSNFISIQTDLELDYYAIKSILGKVQFSGNQFNQIDVSSLESGSYFIELYQSNGERTTQQFLIY